MVDGAKLRLKDGSKRNRCLVLVKVEKRNGVLKGLSITRRKLLESVKVDEGSHLLGDANVVGLLEIEDE